MRIRTVIMIMALLGNGSVLADNKPTNNENQAETDKSENASEGTKALLGRIKALEASIADLTLGESNSVANSTYLLQSIFTDYNGGIAKDPNPSDNDPTTIPNYFSHYTWLRVNKVLYTFSSNGTGEMTRYGWCDPTALLVPADGVSDSELREGQHCGPETAIFEWSQNGYEVVVEFISPFSLIATFIVSADGNVLARREISSGTSFDQWSKRLSVVDHLAIRVE